MMTNEKEEYIMRNAVREYVEYTDDEKKNLWTRATFVFDTNIFLNLYRYSNSTRNQLLSSFQRLNDRIWMPHQVAVEFCKDRCKVIDETNKRFDSIDKDVNRTIEDYKNMLHLDGDDADIKKLASYLKKWITRKIENSYLKFNPLNDAVFDKLLDLFDGKVGEEFDADELKTIEQEGNDRYSNHIPPGYKDEKKQDNKYGDLFVWKEIIKYSKSHDVDIVFITHDQKEDWWNIVNGKTIGPRIELRKEFFKETGKMFHMYTMASFLSLINDDKVDNIDKTTINEVESFAARDENVNYYANLEDGFDSFDYHKEKAISNILRNIERLETKNKKRKNSIKTLNNNSKRRKLSIDESVALQRNREYLCVDEDKIARLKNELYHIASSNIK